MDCKNVLVNEKIEKTNTDPKPHICFLNTDFETLSELFLKKIKPMEGIVKYKMVEWKLFPIDLENAKSMSIKWVEKFHSTNLYNEFRIKIYFHLEKKTIRFELRSKNTNIINFLLDDNVEEKILSYEYHQDTSILFNCEKTTYFDECDLEKCKILGKKLSKELEKKYTTNKFVVFLNLNKKTIQIINKK